MLVNLICCNGLIMSEVKGEFLDFIQRENDSLVDILLIEDVVGRDDLFSFFRIDVESITKENVKLFLNEKKDEFISLIQDHFYALTENSIALYSGSCSWDVYSSEFGVYIYEFFDFFIVLVLRDEWGHSVHLCDGLDSAIDKCCFHFIDHLDYLKVEIDNYSSLEENGMDIDSFDLNFEMNFDVFGLLHTTSNIRKDEEERLSSILDEYNNVFG